MLRKIDDIWTAGSYIYFRNLGKWPTLTNKNPSTNTIQVLSEHKEDLGQIRWFGRWRKYCFFPNTGTIYEETCLREIAEFCVTVTKEHRQKKKNKDGAAATAKALIKWARG